MRTTLALLTCALFASTALAQEPVDNSKLTPLLGDWVGTTKFQEMDAAPSSIKGVKAIGDGWIRLDLKFDVPGMGEVEAVALLSTHSDGSVEGHFFISMAPNALSGKGKITDKKLNLIASSLDGETSMKFEFDMSVADVIKFKAADQGSGGEALEGTFTRKK
jgi:hypothetical protein